MSHQLLFFIILTLVSPIISVTWQHCYPCTCHLASGIKRANCMQVPLTSVPQNLSSAIEEIYLNYQQLETIPANAFAKLSNLQKVFIDRCNITSLQKESFRNLNRLTDLSVMKNELRQLPPTLFQTNKRLKYIWLDSNMIESLPDGLFTNLTALNGLYARFNQIHSIGLNAFGNNPNLWLIDLTNNRLKRMDGTIIERLKSVTYLFLHDNQWICDCQLRKLRQIMEDRHIFHRSQPNCSEPRSLQGQTWSSIKTNEFKCWLHIISPVDNVTNIITSDKVTLSCHCTSSPEPLIKWFYKHNLLTLKDNKYIFGNDWKSNMTILNLNINDTGEYKCVISNNIEVLNRYFTVTVQANQTPVVETSQNITVYENRENVNLSCKISAFPQPNITWWFNGKRITGSMTHVLSHFSVNLNTFWYNLTIANVTSNSTGQYNCVAVNNIGNDNKSVYLFVRTLNITRIKIMTDSNLTEMENITLSCLVTAALKPSIRWEFNERLLNDSNKYYVVFKDLGNETYLGKLTIFTVQLKDEGYYKCIAQNTKNSQSDQYNLAMKLNYLPSIVEPANLTIFTTIETENITLPCHVSGYPEPVILWMKNTEVISENTNKYNLFYAKINSDTFIYKLKIVNSTLTDENNYVCKAIQGNYTISKKMSLKIIPKQLPVINIITNMNKTIYEGAKNCRITCIAVAIPIPDVFFVKDKILISNNSVMLQNDYLISYLLVKTFEIHVELVIVRVNTNNNGTYTCIAKNSAGVKEETVLLNVKTVDQLMEYNNVSALVLLMLLVVLFFIPILTCLCKRYLQHSATYKVKQSDKIEEDGNTQSINCDAEKATTENIQISYVANHKNHIEDKLSA